MSAASIDFNRDEVDIAIRVGRTDQFSEEVGGNELARVKATALFPDVLVPVCSGEVLRGGPQIKTLDDLRGHVLLHTTTRRNAWAEWFHGMGAPPIVSPHEIWYGHFFMTHQAACEGKGIAMLPMIFVSEDLSSGRLVKAIDTPVVSSECYYMVYQEHLSSSRSVSLFRSWIQAESREPLEFADSLV